MNVFLRFSNDVNGTKSRKALHLEEKWVREIMDSGMIHVAEKIFAKKSSSKLEVNRGR